jgi:TonB family protein
LAYVAALDLPQAKVDRAAESIQNRFSFNAAAVTREAFNTNQSEWVSALRQETGLADLSPETNHSEFSTMYPQRVCLTDAPGEIAVGAVVNPDGSWRGAPTLLRSSGYGALDRKALQEIERHRFAASDGIKAYVLTLDTSVDYGGRPCLNPNPAS